MKKPSAYSKMPENWKEAIALNASVANREKLAKGINKQIQFNIEAATIEKFDEVIALLSSQSVLNNANRANAFRFILKTFCDQNNINHSIEVK